MTDRNCWIVLLQMCFILRIIIGITADCSNVFPNTPTFGKDCKYRCRCKDDAQCDVISGDCPSGCLYGWIGPACQYRNIVKHNTGVRQFGEGTDPGESAGQAVDGDFTTCSWTDPRSYDGRQLWMIELDREYRLVGLILHLSPADLEHFEGFKVEFGTFWSTFPELCYELSTSPDAGTLEIMCDRAIVAQYMRIIVNANDVPIRLCEVEIYGGRDVSFNTVATGSLPYQQWLPHKAVDGRYLMADEMTERARAQTCFATVPVTDPWWTVDLGHTYDILDVVYYGREGNHLDQMSGFYISTTDDITSSNFTTIYTDDEDNSDDDYLPRETTFTTTYNARIIHIGRGKSHKTQLAICEMMVFAECPEDKCGWDCSIECHCSSPYITGSYKITGVCPYGCKDRWSGHDGRCDTECCSTMWGPECGSPCGHCDSMPCDVVDGTCPGGCEGPWQPPLCIEECDDGTYGLNCTEECGHCKSRAACDRVTGLCLTGCENDLATPYCQQAIEEDITETFTFSVGIGVGALAVAVLLETITIAILCRYRRLKLKAHGNTAAQPVSWKKTGVPGQTDLPSSDVQIHV